MAKIVNWQDEYDEVNRLSSELQNYSKSLGIEGYRVVEVTTTTTRRTVLKARVNWGAIGSTEPEVALAFSKVLMKASELANNYKYNGYIIDWSK